MNTRRCVGQVFVSLLGLVVISSVPLTKDVIAAGSAMLRLYDPGISFERLLPIQTTGTAQEVPRQVRLKALLSHRRHCLDLTPSV
jgi:hypothetical protein